MRRVLALAPLLLLIGSGGIVHADGCPPATCGVESVAMPGSPVVTLHPLGGIAAYDIRTGAKRFSLSTGIASADARTVVSVANRRHASILRRYDGWTGRLLGARRFGRLLWPATLSANGRRVVLVDARSNRRRTTFTVASTSGRAVRKIVLHGSFSPDALSNDGKRLFVIQYVGNAYRVRLYDLASGRLRQGSVRVKNETEPMRGYAHHAIASPDGRWLLTLYIKPRAHEAFVHALDLRRSVAYCLDLPGEARPESMALYALALAPNGHTLYAANRALGVVAKVDLTRLRVRIAARFHGDDRNKPQYASAVTASRGRALWFGDVRGLWLFRGSVRGPFRVGPVGGFGLTPSGRRLTVIRVGGRSPLQLDAHTGAKVATLPR